MSDAELAKRAQLHALSLDYLFRAHRAGSFRDRKLIGRLRSGGAFRSLRLLPMFDELLDATVHPPIAPRPAA